MAENTLLLLILEILAIATDRGIAWLLEHPEAPNGGTGASIWFLEEVESLEKKVSDFCFGTLRRYHPYRPQATHLDRTTPGEEEYTFHISMC